MHCLDAKTGAVYWVHPTGSMVMGSTLAADGRIYAGNEKGFVTVLAQGKEKKLLAEVKLPAAIYNTPVAADGVLYVACQTHLYAVAVGKDAAK
jgi:outer membrane protein assembly factor BamB